MTVTLAGRAEHELVVRKSRFIACVEPMADRAGALQRVAALRAAHPTATHVCWALIAGGQSAAVDDGEPCGTAGQPMLRVLRHQDLEGVLATVVRYFGGVKLGAGGLVRAYTDAVAQALLTAHKVEIQRLVRLACSVPYALEGPLRRTLEQVGAQLDEVGHDLDVHFRFRCVETEAPALRARLEEVGHGALRWHVPNDEDAADDSDSG